MEPYYAFTANSGDGDLSASGVSVSDPDPLTHQSVLAGHGASKYYAAPTTLLPASASSSKRSTLVEIHCDEIRKSEMEERDELYRTIKSLKEREKDLKVTINTLASQLKDKDKHLVEKNEELKECEEELKSVLECKKEVEKKLRKVSKDGKKVTLQGVSECDSVEYMHDKDHFLGRGRMSSVYSVPPTHSSSLQNVYCGREDMDRASKTITKLEEQKSQLEQKISSLEKEREKDQAERETDKSEIQILSQELEDVCEKLKSEHSKRQELEDVCKKLKSECSKVFEEEGKIILDNPGQLERVEYVSERDYLGQGLMATIFKGKSSYGYNVAVKVMQVGRNTKKNENEMMFLKQAGNNCDKIVKYYFTVKQMNCFYIIMELCDTSLYQFIIEGQGPESWNSFDRRAAYKNFLHQAMEGLEHLHFIKIIHRDMKPQNILVKKTSAERYGYRVKITDFGLSKEICEGQKSMTKEQRGSCGWTAPEILNGAKVFTEAVDIFCIGCVMHFVLTDGKHPFSDDIDLRNSRIKDKNFKPELGDYPIKKLVEDMIAFNPKDRPSALLIKGHCFFWDEERQISFIIDVMVMLDSCSAEEKMIMENDIMGEIMAGIVKVNDVTEWCDILDEEIRKDFLGTDSHTCSSLCCLLRDKIIHPPAKEVVIKLKKALCLDKERINNPSIQSQPTVQASGKPVELMTSSAEGIVMTHTKSSKASEMPNGSTGNSNNQRVFCSNLENQRQKDNIIAQCKVPAFNIVVAEAAITGPATITTATTTGPASTTTAGSATTTTSSTTTGPDSTDAMATDPPSVTDPSTTVTDPPMEPPVTADQPTGSFNVADKIVVLRYLTSRFPMLLVSTWHAMKEKYGDSDNLRQYYPPHADSSIPTH